MRFDNDVYNHAYFTERIAIMKARDGINFADLVFATSDMFWWLFAGFVVVSFCLYNWRLYHFCLAEFDFKFSPSQKTAETFIKQSLWLVCVVFGFSFLFVFGFGVFEMSRGVIFEMVVVDSFGTARFTPLTLYLFNAVGGYSIFNIGYFFIFTKRIFPVLFKAVLG